MSSCAPRLEARGHRYRTHSDTETIVHLYEEYGRDCVKHLRGMFAFAIWDRRKRVLFAARDRLGIKPFYYRWDGRAFLFGSEIKAILAYPGGRGRVQPWHAVGISGLRLHYRSRDDVRGNPEADAGTYPGARRAGRAQH